MAPIRVKTESRFSQGGIRLLLCVVLAGCASIVVAIPTPVAPSERPSLVVDRRVDRQLLARDARLAASLPSDSSAQALDRVVLDAGRLEARSPRDRGDAVELLASRAQTARIAVVSAHGLQALAASRAKAVLRFVDHFDESDVSADDPSIVGGFRLALERWNAIRDDRSIAPPLVVRTLYAARWNTIVGLPPTSGFGREELRAYHGWLALHAEGIPREVRLASTAAYRQAGGDSAEEALAILLLEDGSTVSAEQAFERLFERRHGLRLRNHALAAHVLAR